MAIPSINFTAVLSAAGIPTTRTELEVQWRAEMNAVGSLISNDSAYSPFWRIITALVTLPALWFVEFLAGTILPQGFLAYASGVFLDAFAWSVNLERKPATATRGYITFTRTSSAGNLTIPAGTRIESAALAGTVYALLTLTDTTLPDGQLTGAVLCEAVETGTAYNLAAGYYAVLPQSIAGIASATNANDWITRPGADLETDEALRARCRNQFGTAAKFHTDAVYRSLIASFPGVGIDNIYFQHNAPRGPGTANAFILFDFGADASAYLVTINDYITDQGFHGHGDDLQCFELPEQDIDLAIVCYVDANLSDGDRSTLADDVEAFVRCAFRESAAYPATQTFPFNRFSFSKLGKELHEQFPALESLDFSLDDIVAGLWVPRLDSLTITVQDAE